LKRSLYRLKIRISPQQDQYESGGIVKITGTVSMSFWKGILTLVLLLLLIHNSRNNTKKDIKG